MRIVFLGLPLAALLLGADGHDVVLAGLRSSLVVGARRLRARVGTAHVVLDPHQDWALFVKRAAAARADLLVSWFFTRKIPMELAGACRLGGIGVHPSLLPRHRGPDPFFAAIDAGDSCSGVTVHRLAAEFDTGAVLAQRVVSIDPSWNAWQLARRLDRPSLEALREVVQRAAQGDPLIGQEQDHTQATDAPQPQDELRELVWNLPAERIVRRVRALAPTPGAVAWLGESCLTILRVEATDLFPRALAPGEAAVVDGRAVVRVADRAVVLLQAEIDDATLGAPEIAMLVACTAQK